MNKFEEKLKIAASELTLTPEEKSAMRAALASAMHPAEHRSIVSPYLRFTYLSRSLVAGALVLALIGTGTAYAAEGALPGDPLYSVKIDVVEPAIGALQTTPQAKADWQAHLAETRLVEAETLAAQDKLSAPLAAQIQNNFDQHAQAAAELAQEVNKENPQTDDTLAVQITANLNAHSAVLLALASTTPSNDSNETFELARNAMVQVHQAQHAIDANEAEATSSPQEKHGAAKPFLNGENTTMSSSTVSRTSSSTSTFTSSATTTASTTFPSAKHGSVTELRSLALAQITSLQNILGASNLSSSTATQIQAGLESALQAIATADTSSTDSSVALGDYRQALQTAISLKTFLSADQQFPQEHLLPMLLKHQGVENNN